MWIRSPRSSTERRSSRVLAAALAAALCLASAAVRAEEKTPEEIRQQAQSVLDRGYQKDLPGAEGGPGGSGGRRSGRHAPPGDGGSVSDFNLPAAGALSWLALVTLVVLGVVALFLAVLWAARNLPSARAKAAGVPGQDEPPPQQPATEEVLPTLGEAERLAAEGRWSEAVHALLLVAVRRLVSRFSVPHVSSRTSRELSRALPLQGEAREAFAGLVRTVEVSLFGGSPLGPDDWRTSLERYRLLEGRR